MESSTRAIIPVKSLSGAKRRLMLRPDLKRKLTLAMLEDILRASLDATSLQEVIVVSPDREALELGESLGVRTVLEASERGVNAAVKKAVRICQDGRVESCIVIPGDVPLILPEDIDALLKLSSGPASVVITPSNRLDGTNALVMRPPDVIRTYYDQNSFPSHVRESIGGRITCRIAYLKRVMLDIDTNEDLLEISSFRNRTLTQALVRNIDLEAKQRLP